jgi:hypothetical protein
MAKGQRRGNKEVRKPKQKQNQKVKTIAANPSLKGIVKPASS